MQRQKKKVSHICSHTEFTKGSVLSRRRNRSRGGAGLYLPPRMSLGCGTAHPCLAAVEEAIGPCLSVLCTVVPWGVASPPPWSLPQNHAVSHSSLCHPCSAQASTLGGDLCWTARCPFQGCFLMSSSTGPRNVTRKPGQKATACLLGIMRNWGGWGTGVLPCCRTGSCKFRQVIPSCWRVYGHHVPAQMSLLLFFLVKKTMALWGRWVWV